MTNPLPELRIYISFVEDDRKLAEPCAQLLRRTIKAGLKDRYNALFFCPANVPLGEFIHESLERRIDELDIAIALVSNEYILEEKEAKRVSNKQPHPIIVRLVEIQPATRIAPLDWSDFIATPPFDDATADTDRRSIANHVASFVGRILTEREAASRRAEPRLTPDEIAEELSTRARLQLTAEAVPARAKQGLFEQTQSRNGEDGIGPEPSADITDVVKHLVTWACKSTDDSSRLCALLGDLGTGKTTSAILLTRKLLERRKFGEQVPLPFYFDLRDLSPTGLADLGLRTVLTHLLSVSTKLAVMVDDVLDAIRSEPTMVVFDGLDEALVHLSPDDGDRLTQSLLQVLTLNVPNSEAEPPGTHLLLSCRTQYFRTMNDEAFFVNGEESERTHGKDYLVLTMLPFNEKQIREYLRRYVPGSNPDEILKMIRSVHDLRALAAQPVMLNMIRKVLPTIEEDRRMGRRVRSVDLYERFVVRWLRRDERKHSLIPEHKIQLMTHLAWQVWNSGNRTWSASWMETWMIQFLHAHPEMELDYERRMPVQWKQDFRTATFLARRGDNFTFAHSSLLEYFLAKRLADSLLADSEDNALATWDITRPNDETFVFFGELIERLSAPTQHKVLVRLERVGAHGSATTRANVFAYTLRALDKSVPYPSPKALNLSNTDLRGWNIGSEQTQIDLSGVSLTGARLDDTHTIHARLDHVNAVGASMQRALFEHCSLAHANLANADLAGTVFRYCNVAGASLDKACRYRTQLLHTTGHRRELSAILTAPLPKQNLGRVLSKIHIFSGHSAHIFAVACSPGGTFILTGSGDGTARVWDATTGENTLTFAHERPVNAVAWSPDATHILTGSGDGTARVWDATTGKKTLTLKVSTKAAAWSPDATHILTASSNGIVGMWNATTGQNIHTLTLTKWIEAAAWSPDATSIVTVSHNGIVGMWDATTGNSTLTLTESTKAAAWSSNGTRVLTASTERTAHIRDATTGEQGGFFITALPDGECAVLTPDQTRVIGASPYAWRWLRRYAVHPDGALERIPVEIDGPLPPLGPGSQAD